jgi:hypothetical protein
VIERAKECSSSYRAIASLIVPILLPWRPAVATLEPILSKTRIERHRREYKRVSAGAAGFQKSCCIYATLACCIGAAGFKDGR